MIENFMWMPYPYVRYVSFLISGILVSNYVGGDILFELCFKIFSALFVLAFLCKKWLNPDFLNSVLGVMGLLIIFNTGALRFYQNDHRNHSGHLIRYEDQIQYYTADIISDVSIRKNHLRYEINIRSVKSKKGWFRVKANAYLYIKSDSLLALGYGKRVLVKGRPREIKKTSNPNAFDYQIYLARQNIFHQHFISRNDMIECGDGNSYYLPFIAYSLRRRVKNVVQGAIKSNRESSIVLSLLIGEKDALSEDVKETYSNVGAMHVLAVSGLHVGIVYLLLSMILGFLKNHRKGKWLFLVVCLFALWFYALLTGLSTSVLRASVMFTFILLSEVLGRKSSIYNNIALAAFLLLLFNPFFLFQVGFQLSFIAVTGIVYLQPKIVRWFRFKYWILNKVWSLTSVSLAAQLATFPISVYYFHQFPTYFWLTNMLVIPSATIIIFLGISVSVLGLAGISISIISTLLEQWVFFTNEGLIRIESLPLSSIRDLYFTFSDLALLYTSILTLILFFRTFKIRYLAGSVFLLFLISCQSLLHYIQTYRQQQIVFYDINRVCAVDFVNGHQQNLLVVPKEGTTMPSLYGPIANYRMAHQLKTQDLSEPMATFDSLNPHGDAAYQFFRCHSIVVLLLNEKMDLGLGHEEKINVDYLLINNHAILNFKQISAHFKFHKLIITNLNSFKYASDLYNYCQKNDINVYSILHHGALVENVGSIKNLD